MTRGRRCFIAGLVAMTSSLACLLLLVHVHVAGTLLRWVLMGLILPSTLGGMALLSLERWVRCPNCEGRVVLGRGRCKSFCQKCGGGIEKQPDGGRFFSLVRYRSTKCGADPGRQRQHITSIRHCPHCGLKLGEE